MFQIPQCCTNFTKKNPTTSPLFTTYLSKYILSCTVIPTIYNLKFDKKKEKKKNSAGSNSPILPYGY